MPSPHAFHEYSYIHQHICTCTHKIFSYTGTHILGVYYPIIQILTSPYLGNLVFFFSIPDWYIMLQCIFFCSHHFTHAKPLECIFKITSVELLGQYFWVVVNTVKIGFCKILVNTVKLLSPVYIPLRICLSSNYFQKQILEQGWVIGN